MTITNKENCSSYLISYAQVIPQDRALCSSNQQHERADVWSRENVVRAVRTPPKSKIPCVPLFPHHHFSLIATMGRGPYVYFSQHLAVTDIPLGRSIRSVSARHRTGCSTNSPAAMPPRHRPVRTNCVTVCRLSSFFATA